MKLLLVIHILAVVAIYDCQGRRPRIPVADCDFTEWTEWGQCTFGASYAIPGKCGKGFQLRYRQRQDLSGSGSLPTLFRRRVCQRKCSPRLVKIRPCSLPDPGTVTCDFQLPATSSSSVCNDGIGINTLYNVQVSPPFPTSANHLNMIASSAAPSFLPPFAYYYISQIFPGGTYCISYDSELGGNTMLQLVKLPSEILTASANDSASLVGQSLVYPPVSYRGRCGRLGQIACRHEKEGDDGFVSSSETFKTRDLFVLGFVLTPEPDGISFTSGKLDNIQISKGACSN